MAELIEQVKGRIVDFDEKSSEIIIRAKYGDLATLIRREYREVDITLLDSRPLSSKQRRACYEMIRNISDFSGESLQETKEFLKIQFWTSELWRTADTLFSLSDAPMSIVAAFQKWIARFIVENDIPTKMPMLSYVDDVSDYIYACLASKKCCICGRPSDLHHVERVGMGRNRDEIIHEGMEVLPLCREHHTEAHTMPDHEFFYKYHIDNGVRLDKALCKYYGLRSY